MTYIMRNTKEEALAEFSDILTLEDGWAGEGSLAPRTETLTTGESLLQKLLSTTKPPVVTPEDNGTISFEWFEGTSSAHLEIGLTKYAMYVATESKPSIYFNGMIADLSTNIPDMIETLNSSFTTTKKEEK